MSTRYATQPDRLEARHTCLCCEAGRVSSVNNACYLERDDATSGGRPSVLGTRQSRLSPRLTLLSTCSLGRGSSLARVDRRDQADRRRRAATNSGSSAAGSRGEPNADAAPGNQPHRFDGVFASSRSWLEVALAVGRSTIGEWSFDPRRSCLSGLPSCPRLLVAERCSEGNIS